MSEQLAFDLTRGSQDRLRVNKVFAAIRTHVGRENAIAIIAISKATEVSYRDIQAIVKFLVEERSIPIGTAPSRPFGYYLIRNERELEANYRHFVRRGVSNLKHARAYHNDSIVGPIVGQLELEINKEDER